MRLNGIGVGSTFDLRPNKYGDSYDLTTAGDRAKVRSILRTERPYLVIGCPPCTEFCQTQRNWNHPRMAPEEVKRRLIEAHIHLQFSEEIYRFQLHRGKHFLHEHPASAASWTEEVIVNLNSDPRVSTTTCHMCQYGMQHRDKDGVLRHVLKPTRWMSTSPYILKRLSRKCPRGCKSVGGHEHTTLFGAEKTKAASVYPPALCREILLGTREQ